MLFTVFGDLTSSCAFNRCTSSLLIASRCRRPNAGIRYNRRIMVFDAIPLGFCRFARAWPSTKRGANSIDTMGKFDDELVYVRESLAAEYCVY